MKETNEIGTVAAADWLFHNSSDGCLQSDCYETGKNRYGSDEPYPHDELMVFVDDGVTLAPQCGEAIVVKAVDMIAISAGWRGVWKSDGYRKFYAIYECP